MISKVQVVNFVAINLEKNLKEKHICIANIAIATTAITIIT